MTHEKRVLYESFRKYRGLIALAIGFSLLKAVFEGFSIGLLVPFLEGLTGADGGATFRTGWAWADQHLLGVGASKLSRMYRVCGLILVAIWLRTASGYLANIFSVKGTERVLEDLRCRLTDQFQAVSLRFFAQANAGELINSLTNELHRVKRALGVVKTYISQGLIATVYLGLMVLISWKLALFTLVAVGGLAAGLSWLVRRVRRRSQRITDANNRFMSTAKEFLDGVRTVKAFGQEDFERDRIHRAAHDRADAIIDVSWWQKLLTPLSRAVMGTVLIAVVVAAVQFLVFTGQLSMALLLTFLFALLRLVPLVHQLNGQRGQWAQFNAALENVGDLLRTDDKPYLKDGPLEEVTLRDAITFEDVSFAYEPGEPVLTGIDLRIERGRTTALVGASGAGKTTLADLIPRLYDPTEGAVCIDGTDLRRFRLAALRGKIAVVNQDTHIFNAPVRENLAYGRRDASFERIAEVAEQANALGFIEQMAGGFDTVLGDRGVRLSGGQRQRIAIARALLCDPEILILDEATSALDSVSERQVQASLERLMEGRTVVAIAHRLSTIEGADKVVVLEEGRIVEQGTYGELLEQGGQLHEYHEIQYQMA
jgi:subfamily B ATP-binding cassette protein MsbA